MAHGAPATPEYVSSDDEDDAGEEELRDARVRARKYFSGQYARSRVYDSRHEVDPLLARQQKIVVLDGLDAADRPLPSWNMTWSAETPGASENARDSVHLRRLLLSESEMAVAMQSMLPMRQHGIAVLTSATITPKSSGSSTAGDGGWKRFGSPLWHQQLYQNDLPLFKCCGSSPGLRMVLFVINDGVHWSLLVQFRDPDSMYGKRLYHYDSNGELNLGVARRTVELYNRENQFGANTPPLFTESGDSGEVAIVSVPSLQQGDCWECGYFVIGVAKLILDRAIAGIYAPLTANEIAGALVPRTRLHITIRDTLQQWMRVMVQTYDEKLYKTLERFDDEEYLRMFARQFLGADVRQLDVMLLARGAFVTKRALTHLVRRLVPSQVHGSGATYEILESLEEFLDEVRQVEKDIAQQSADDQILLTFHEERFSQDPAPGATVPPGDEERAMKQKHSPRFSLLSVYHQGAVYLYDLSGRSTVLRSFGLLGQNLRERFGLAGGATKVVVVDTAVSTGHEPSRFESNVLAFLLAERIIRAHKPLLGAIEYQRHFLDALLGILSPIRNLTSVSKYLLDAFVRDYAVLNYTEMPVYWITNEKTGKQDWIFLLKALPRSLEGATTADLIVSLRSEEWEKKQKLQAEQSVQHEQRITLGDLLYYQDFDEQTGEEGELISLTMYLGQTDNSEFKALEMQPFNRSPNAKQDHMGVVAILNSMDFDARLHIYNRSKQALSTMPFGLVSFPDKDEQLALDEILPLMSRPGARAHLGKPTMPETMQIYREDADVALFKTHGAWHALKPFINPLEEVGGETTASDGAGASELDATTTSFGRKRVYMIESGTKRFSDRGGMVLDTVDWFSVYQRMYRVFDAEAISALELRVFQQLIEASWIFEADASTSEADASTSASSDRVESYMMNVLMRVPHTIMDPRQNKWLHLSELATYDEAVELARSLNEDMDLLKDEEDSSSALSQVQEDQLHDLLYARIRLFPVSIVSGDAEHPGKYKRRIFSYTGLLAYVRNRVGVTWDEEAEQQLLAKAISSTNNTFEWYEHTYVHSSIGMLELVVPGHMDHLEFRYAMAYLGDRIKALILAQTVAPISEYLRVNNTVLPNIQTIQRLGL